MSNDDDVEKYQIGSETLKPFSEEAQFLVKTILLMVVNKEIDGMSRMAEAVALGASIQQTRKSLPKMKDISEEVRAMMRKIYHLTEGVVEDGADTGILVTWVAAKEMVKMQTHIKSLEDVIAHGEKK